MKKVLTIGGAVYDIFIEYQSPETLNLHTHEINKRFLVLEEGAKVEVRNLAYRSGGGATNSAVSFQKLGYETSSFFKIGSDAQGAAIIDELNAAQVNTELVVKDTLHATGTSFIFPTPHDRIVLVYRGASMHLHENELPLKAIESMDQLYITSLSGAASALLPLITAHAKKHNVAVAINPGTSQLKEHTAPLEAALQNTDILIMNSHEAQILCHALSTSCPALTQEIQHSDAQIDPRCLPPLLQSSVRYENICYNIKMFFKEMLSRGPRIVAITDGAHGVYVATGNTIYFHPSLPSEIVSTLGAGDAFGSAFVAHIAHGASVADALRAGIINACSVISKVGAKNGLLTLQEIAHRLHTVAPALLQEFQL